MEIEDNYFFKLLKVESKSDFIAIQQEQAPIKWKIWLLEKNSVDVVPKLKTKIVIYKINLRESENTVQTQRDRNHKKNS